MERSLDCRDKIATEDFIVKSETDDSVGGRQEISDESTIRSFQWF